MLFILLEHPHIVHNHTLWKISAAIRVARPLTTDRYIENKEEVIVERISRGRNCSICNLVKLHIIQQPGDFVLLPNGRKNVEFIAEFGCA